MNAQRLSDTELIEIFGRDEVKGLCKEKLNELYYEHTQEVELFKKLEYLRKDRKPAGVFIELLHGITGKNIELLYKEMSRLSRLYRLTIGHSVNTSKVTVEDIQRAKDYPTHELYDGQLRKISKGFIVRCPFHKENTPSFVFYDTGAFHCFGCEVHGHNAIDYLIQLKKLSFLEALEILN